MKKPATPTAPTEKALKLRERVKKSKPSFVRQESWRYVRLKESWRRPRGLDNKMRRKIKGWPPTVNAGYRGPKVARGLHPSGCVEVLVYNAKDLEKVDPENQAARIAHTVGRRKRGNILAEARKRKIRILNLKEVKEVKEAAEEEKELVGTAETEKEEKTEEKEEAKEEEKAEAEKPKPRRKKAEKPKRGAEK
jgi:large subunit ribosomal protein L32e